MSSGDRSGPHEELDLRAAIEALVGSTPGIERVYLFGSRVHKTQSLRSDIDLLVFGKGLAAAKMSVLQWGVSPFLDVFIVAGSTAVSAANQSMIAADSPDELIRLTSAAELWRGEWVGDEAFVTQDILAEHAPSPTVAVVGAEYLSVDAVDYLFVTALPTEFRAAVSAVGSTTPGRADRSLVSHHLGEIESPHGRKNVAIVVLPNIGMVAAALTTNRLLEGVDAGLVVLLGITGAVKGPGVHLGDIVIPSNVFDYEAAKATSEGDRLNPTIVPIPRHVYQRIREFDFGTWREDAVAGLPSMGSALALRVHLDRTMACGHKVIADQDRALLLQETDRKTLAIEMESYGVAEACRYVVPERDYIVIKGITDWADATKNDEWHAFCCAACARLAVDLIKAGVI